MHVTHNEGRGEMNSSPLSFLLMLSRIFEIYSIDCLITLRSRCPFYIASKLGILYFVGGEDNVFTKIGQKAKARPVGSNLLMSI